MQKNKKDLNPRPTEKDIEKTYPSGAYTLGCDGRHENLRHVYYFYTKKEVIKRWRDEHPRDDKTRLAYSSGTW